MECMLEEAKTLGVDDARKSPVPRSFHLVKTLFQLPLAASRGRRSFILTLKMEGKRSLRLLHASVLCNWAEMK